MAMQQHYYTSCVLGTSGSAGFQCKAKSSGLSANDLNAIHGMVSYRIPSSLDEKAISTHPVALRYDYVSSDKCYLVNSQSNGPDENGRPGNFFAHTVVTKPEDFEIYPPIMFWRHPFWKSIDLNNKLELPVEEEFQLKPSLSFDEIWPFLKVGNRMEWFRKLLAAVIRYDSEKRPIVILDDHDNVALWIATLTFALPRIYRPFISFATYHHDPYQTSYRITGTSDDSKFRFSSDEYISFFLLNAKVNRISEVEPTKYADFVAANYSPELYHDKLLDFFEMCNSRLPNRPLRSLDKVLDATTSFYLVVWEKSLPPSTTEAQESLSAFLNYIESKESLMPEDLEELSATADTLAKSIYDSGSSQTLRNFERALRLLKKHDHAFTDRCPRDLEIWSDFLEAGDLALAEQLLQILAGVYGRVIGNYASRGTYLNKLTAILSPLPWQAHKLVWARLIPLITLTNESKASVEKILWQTLETCDKLAGPDTRTPSEEAEDLLTAVIKNTQRNSGFLLSGSMDWYKQTHGFAFFWLYYALVKNKSLAERRPFRAQVQRVSADITLYEVYRDSRATSIIGLTRLLEDWLIDLTDEPQLRARVISQCLEPHWNKLANEQRYGLAEQMLSSQIVSPNLQPPWEDRLLESFFTGISFSILSADRLKLYERYNTYPKLKDQQRALLSGSIAITVREFPKNTVDIINECLGNLDQLAYQDASALFIEAFFSGDVDVDSHLEMLQATYIRQHNDSFWDCYWTFFAQLLGDRSRVQQSVELLSFWFEKLPVILGESHYIVPAFFMRLPSVLAEIVANKNNLTAISGISKSAARMKWYPLVVESLAQKKQGIFGRFR